jgi:DNA-binding GntR family transcriptional regulator
MNNIDKILEEIEYEYMTGQIRPKQKLVETELMARFSLGRGAVRDILKILKERGLVVHHSNKGAFVIDFTARQVRDIYFLRSTLDVIASRLAFECLSEANINEMAYLQSQLKSAKQTDKHLVRMHEAFHNMIIKAAGNEFLEREIKCLILLTAPIRYFTYARTDRRLVVLQQHDGMIEALRKRDRDSFIALCLDHLYLSMKEYLSIFHPTEAEALIVEYKQMIRVIGQGYRCHFE